ncbi:MAG: hypothetical protein PHY29_06620 [Syntrophales bacterium]|nr:hypothetical protein [Syntrophales bacterium]
MRGSRHRIRLLFKTLEKIVGEIIREIPSFVSITCNITSKPPPTFDAI